MQEFMIYGLVSVALIITSFFGGRRWKSNRLVGAAAALEEFKSVDEMVYSFTTRLGELGIRIMQQEAALIDIRIELKNLMEANEALEIQNLALNKQIKELLENDYPGEN